MKTKRNQQRLSSQMGIESLENRQLLSAALPYGTPVSGTINSVGEVDEYKFSAPANAKIQILGTALATAGSFHARFRLLGPAPALQDLGFFDSASKLSNFVQKEALPFAGDYTIQVSDSQKKAFGSYTLEVEGINPINSSHLQVVKGGIVNGSIDNKIDVKEYAFNGNAGDKIQLAGTALATTGSFHARFKLWGPSGQDLGLFDVASQRTNTFFVQSLPVTGQYMVQVYDSNHADTGTFSLGFESFKPASPDAVQIFNNKQASAPTSSPIDVKQYTFKSLAGDTVSFTATALATTGSFHARFRLYGPSGQDLGLFDVASKGVNSKSYGPLPESGQYVLAVADSNYADTGSFTIAGKGLRGTRPVISSLSASPNPAVVGATVTLTANSVSDADGDLKSVSFYRETNKIAGLQTGSGGDTLISTDSNSADGWKAAFSTTALTAGSYSFYAQATDATALTSDAAKADLALNNAGSIIGLVATDSTGAESAFGAPSSGMFTLYRKNDIRKPVSIVLQLAGTANYGSDFTFTVGGASSWSFDTGTKRLTLSLAANAKGASILVNVLNDSLTESTETVQLSALASSAFSIDAGKGISTVSIIDRMSL